jgi:hypothetical protein
MIAVTARTGDRVTPRWQERYWEHRDRSSEGVMFALAESLIFGNTVLVLPRLHMKLQQPISESRIQP